MPQQLIQERPASRAPTVETEQQESLDAHLERVNDEEVAVALTRTRIVATREETGKEETISIDEETDQTHFTVQLEDAVYQEFGLDVWEVVAQALDTGHHVSVHDIAAPTVAVGSPAALEHEHLRSDTPVREMRAARSTRDRPVPARRDLQVTTYQRPDFSDWQYREEKEPVQHQERPRKSGDRAYADPSQPLVSQGYRTSFLPAPGEDQTTVQEPGIKDLQRVETAEDRRIAYTVATDGMTVADSVLSLVEEGELEATVVEQPYFAPKSFDIAGEAVSAGWQEQSWFVQLEDMDVQMTEFSYGRDDIRLAMDGIDEVSLSPGDRVVLEESEDYACGGYDVDDEIRAAWEERYRWFDDGLKRAVYAAMAEGNTFQGASLDLAAHDMEDVRQAYLSDFGRAPEDTFENVTYTPAR